MLSLGLISKVIFGIGTLASLGLAFYKYKHDRKFSFLILSIVALTASVSGFLITVQLSAPRVISLTERNRISAKMQAFAGNEYTGLVASGVADGWPLWRRFRCHWIQRTGIFGAAFSGPLTDYIVARRVSGRHR